MLTGRLPSFECLLFLMLIPVTSFIGAITGFFLLLRDSSFIHGTQGISIISYETETSNIIIVRTKIFLEHFRKKISALSLFCVKALQFMSIYGPCVLKVKKSPKNKVFHLISMSPGGLICMGADYESTAVWSHCVSLSIWRKTSKELEDLASLSQGVALSHDC